MYRVGVTGGIGSGKTMVCSMLQKLGAAIYHADDKARSLMNSDAGLKSGIVALFGEEAYRDECLDRAYLADLVFGNSELLTQLNKLVHPVVRQDFDRWAQKQTESLYVVEEAAILFESGASQEMDLSVLVSAPEEVRINRVMERDGVSREKVISRMKHQLDEAEKMKLAGHLIYNDGEKMLLPQVVELHNKVLNSR